MSVNNHGLQVTSRAAIMMERHGNVKVAIAHKPDRETSQRITNKREMRMRGTKQTRPPRHNQSLMTIMAMLVNESVYNQDESSKNILFVNYSNPLLMKFKLFFSAMKAPLASRGIPMPYVARPHTHRSTPPHTPAPAAPSRPPFARAACCLNDEKCKTTPNTVVTWAAPP